MFFHSYSAQTQNFNYDDMKKIFRGVALEQNKIAASKINIEANIKCKMPQFYDDEDSGEDQSKEKQEVVHTQPKVEPVKAESR